VGLILSYYRADELMLEHERMYQLPEPGSNDFDFMREFSDECLQPPDNAIWKLDEKGKREYDLVALSTRSDGDPFSMWFFDKLHPLYHKLFVEGRIEPNEMGIYEYDDKSLRRIIANASIIISSLLPLASIFALFFIERPIFGLVFILIFSALFSACLAFATTASRIEIFVATMAIISVQVLFIGSPNAGGSAP